MSLRLEPVRRDDDRSGPDARESAMAAAGAIALVLVFGVVAIVAYWALIFHSG